MIERYLTVILAAIVFALVFVGLMSAIRPAQAAVDLSDFPGLKLQCGPITIIVTQKEK
jgi:hypothetical protein